MQYPIETSISRYRDSCYAYFLQQLATGFVLHIEMRKTTQHPRIATGIPSEEYLLRTEDTGHAVNRDISVLQNMQVIIPKLVLDEERHHRTYQTQETESIERRIKRQVANDVSSLVVLTHLVTRRRKEGEQYLILRMQLTKAFHNRTSLFKLAQRGSMKPQVSCIRVYLLSEQAECIALATPHLPDFAVKKTGDDNAQHVEIYGYIVNHILFLILRLEAIHPYERISA